MQNGRDAFCHITCLDISKLFYCSWPHSFLLFFFYDATLIMAETPEMRQ
jgi:hypothetical protein